VAGFENNNLQISRVHDMTPNRACGRCEFWHFEGDNAGWDSSGECRLHPPTRGQGSGWQFPRTDANQWCGQFELAENIARGEHLETWRKAFG
jgi:hypothetical protein